MRLTQGITAAAAMALAAIAPAYATAPPAARVGSIDYVEGKAFVDGRATSGTRTQLPILDNGQSLSTADGHAEMLLTPGVFLRLDAHSNIRLVNAGLIDTRLRLDQGAAILEVDNLHKDNLIRVDVGAGTVRILKNGLYRFSASPAAVEVFSGQVEAAGQDVQLKAGKHRQIAFAPVPTISKFKSPSDDDLSRWSRVRSQYEAEASVASAQYVFDVGGPWAYADWMWNPWYSTWTWFPASGMWMNPYGFGLVSPWMAYDYYPTRFYGGRRLGSTPYSRAASGGISRFHSRAGFGTMRAPAARMGTGRMGMGAARPAAGRMGRR